MRRSSLLKAAGILVPLIILIGVIRSPKTVPDPVAVEVSPDTLLNAADFCFTFGDGSGWHGYNVVKVQADDACQYTFLDVTAIGRTQQWRRAEFHVDQQTVHDLRNLLNAVQFFGLKREYHDVRIQDGTQRFVKVEASGKRKGVYCDNYFPSEIEDIRRFVEQRIIGAHRQQIDKAAIINLGPKEMEPEQFP